MPVMVTSIRLAELARLAAWPTAETGRTARPGGDTAAWAAAGERMAELVALSALWRDEITEPGGRLGQLLELNGEQVLAERARMERTDSAAQLATLADG